MSWEVLQGDCLELLADMPDGSVDAVVTDPPYSSGGQFRGDRTQSTRTKYVQSNAKHNIAGFSGDNRDQRGFLAWATLWLGQCRRLTVDGGMVCVFTDWRQLPTVTDAVQAAGWVWRGVAVLDKVSARPCLGRFSQQAEFVVWGTNGPRPVEGKHEPGVWREPTPKGPNRVHITQKPEGVMRGVLGPIREGGTVLDPFAGSGSTGVAAVANGYNFIGCELDPDYCQIARDRIAAAASKAEHRQPELI